MNDNSYNDQPNGRLYSLRQRYLFVSSIIVLLIFALAWMAQVYVTQSSQQYRHNIELRHQATQYIRQLRHEVQHIEKALDAFMWAPTADQREEVHHTIDRSLHYFELLRLHEWLAKQQIEQELGDFVLDLKSLHITLERVMEMRQKNPTGQAPLTGLTSNLEQADRQFNQARSELQQRTPALSPYLLSLPVVWQQLYAESKRYLGNKEGGVPSEEYATQQQKIEALQQQLGNVLEQLATRPEIANDSERLQLLEQMRATANLWYLNYDLVKNSIDNTTWRSDIPYLKHTVEPPFEHIWGYLDKLDTHIDQLSKDEALGLGDVASIVAKAVWLLSIFGLLVITVAYLYFQKTVLWPIATVATALKGEASGNEAMPLPEVHNRETRHLIDAFDEMRQQVHDRQQALEHIAMHDSLTTLPNRYHLMGRLQSLCESSEQEQGNFAVMMLGLDRFKEINDTLGQQTGDIMLKEFGQRLHRLLRDSDTIARFASDEFAILLPNTDSAEALCVAQKIRGTMEQPFDIDGITLSVSSSIGMALYPQNGRDREELTRRANIAMAIAKQHKTGTAFYEERLDTSSVERLSLAGRLRQAIQAEGLHLCYQPQFSTHSKGLSGLEVLCRWEDPTRDPVAPGEFIPIAEQTGQIQLLTEWVISTALQQAWQWQRKGLDCGILSVNISVFNLHAPNFLTMLETLLQKYEFPASRLMLEITESAMMADPEHVIRTLRKLQQLGLRLSIDDYGTGFSSLSYVKQLPIHELKIDKSFVMDMISSENDAIIVRSTIDLAHNLGLKVVAEGVDSQEKQELLEILACDILQGYHLGKPLRAEEVEPLLPLRSKGEGKVRHIRDYR